MSLVNCNECGKRVSDNATACPNCGCPINIKNEKPRINRCPCCGFEVLEKNAYCINCGTQLEFANKDKSSKVKQSTQKKSGEGIATASLLCGIAGFLLSCIYIGIIPAIIGIILAIIALCTSGTKIRMAIAGMIISFIAIFFFFSYAMIGHDYDRKEDNIAEGRETEIESDAQEESGDIQAETAVIQEPFEIYNGNSVSIVLSEIEQLKNQVVINFLLISNSDKDYSISAHTYSVNGLMAGGHLYGSDVNLPGGKKTKLSIEIGNQWLEKNGIEKIAELDFCFWAYHDNIKDWDTGTVKIKTNLYDESLMYSVSEKEIYGDSNTTIWYAGKEGNDYSFIIRNNSTYNVDFTIDNCSVNDWSYKITDYTYDLHDKPIQANSYNVFTISVDENFIEEYEISEVKNIEFTITLGDKTTEKIKITD